MNAKPTRANAPYLVTRDPVVRSANDEEDPYRAAEKPPEPTFCPKCHATYHGGRWSWDEPPEDSFQQTCPACQRIHDHFPAGYVTIKGEFFKEHRDEIVQMIRSHAEAEGQRRPLQRLMGIEDTKDGVQVTTADSHLARGIGHALLENYKGDLKMRYSRDENLVRATWKR